MNLEFATRASLRWGGVKYKVLDATSQPIFRLHFKFLALYRSQALTWTVAILASNVAQGSDEIGRASSPAAVCSSIPWQCDSGIEIIDCHLVIGDWRLEIEVKTENECVQIEEARQYLTW